jgi:hypothetical protein
MLQSRALAANAGALENVEMTIWWGSKFLAPA